jgi:hypothetical protein
MISFILRWNISIVCCNLLCKIENLWLLLLPNCRVGEDRWRLGVHARSKSPAASIPRAGRHRVLTHPRQRQSLRTLPWVSRGDSAARPADMLRHSWTHRPLLDMDRELADGGGGLALAETGRVSQPRRCEIKGLSAPKFAPLSGAWSLEPGGRGGVPMHAWNTGIAHCPEAGGGSPWHREDARALCLWAWTKKTVR